jgi:hypothetical protein
MGDFEVPPSARLLRQTAVTHWRTRAGDIDVMLSIPDAKGRPIEFRELEPRAIEVRLADAEVVVAGLEDIIASKDHANRDKDRAALPELRALLERQPERTETTAEPMERRSPESGCGTYPEPPDRGLER